MTPATLPIDEPRRLEALDKLGILFTPAEERFDRITGLAARLLGVPIAQISLIGAHCLWLKSSHGLEASEMPRDVSFCGHTLLADGVMIVPETRADPRFANNPLVTGEPFVRFYAGHPLKSADGSKIGTLCVMDRYPRHLGEEDLEALKDLVALVESELQVCRLSHAQKQLITESDALQRKSMLDAPTRCWNRTAIMDIVQRELARGTRQHSAVGVLLANIDHFRHLHDTHGHRIAHKVLLEVAQRMRSCLRAYDAIGRYGEEELLTVLGDCDWGTAQVIAERIRRTIAERPVVTPAGPLAVTVSLGLHIEAAPQDKSAGDLAAAAALALHQARMGGRNRFACTPPSGQLVTLANRRSVDAHRANSEPAAERENTSFPGSSLL
ncbi:MAG: diguanylate cyclase [Burkholderiales bacterium]